jgi:hypothetical protein
MALTQVAGASSTLVQFETQSNGTRVVTAAVAPSFPAITDLNVSQSIATVVPASVLITEVLARGVNPWSVKAQMCGLVDYAAGSPVADCANKPNVMERADGDTILGSTIAVTGRTGPTVTLGGGTTTTGSESSLAGQITLLNNTSQNPLSVYSGTYAASAGLTITGFTRIGTWKGMWVTTEVL